MNADDPRHGEWAGYNAGCRNDCCRTAARNYQKRLRHDHVNGRRRTVNIIGARRRIHALMRIGWSTELIAQRSGYSFATIQSLSGRPSLKVIHSQKHDRIAAVYSALWDRPGPSREAVKHAIRLGYVSPLAWDDIDDPTAEPVGLSGPGDDDLGGYDESRIERRIAGDRTVRLHKGETVEVVRRLIADGKSSRTIRRDYGIKAERYIKVSETREQVAA